MLITTPLFMPDTWKKEFQNSTEFAALNRGLHLYHHIWRDWVQFMDSFCVVPLISHQFGFR
jgi:hypothetical protein